jgi:hypothetical protein
VSRLRRPDRGRREILGRLRRVSVSAYASKTKSAKLLAVFVVDTLETELTSHSGTEV